MKAIEQYFHVVLFSMLYKVVLTFKSGDKTLVCDHLNESYWAVLSCVTVYFAVQGGFASETLVCDHSNKNVSSWVLHEVADCPLTFWATDRHC